MNSSGAVLNLEKSLKLVNVVNGKTASPPRLPDWPPAWNLDAFRSSTELTLAASHARYLICHWGGGVEFTSVIERGLDQSSTGSRLSRTTTRSCWNAFPTLNCNKSVVRCCSRLPRCVSVIDSEHPTRFRSLPACAMALRWSCRDGHRRVSRYSPPVLGSTSSAGVAAFACRDSGHAHDRPASHHFRGSQ